ncbi:hypothetical protein KA082_03055 [Candidatus Woesebacteria bacterium]|nr:hypothetical protein [Candidatus Woesebacteria bacterium]
MFEQLTRLFSSKKDAPTTSGIHELIPSQKSGPDWYTLLPSKEAQQFELILQENGLSPTEVRSFVNTLIPEARQILQRIKEKTTQTTELTTLIQDRLPAKWKQSMLAAPLVLTLLLSACGSDTTNGSKLPETTLVRHDSEQEKEPKFMIVISIKNLLSETKEGKTFNQTSTITSDDGAGNKQIQTITLSSQEIPDVDGVLRNLEDGHIFTFSVSINRLPERELGTAAITIHDEEPSVKSVSYKLDVGKLEIDNQAIGEDGKPDPTLTVGIVTQ